MKKKQTFVKKPLAAAITGLIVGGVPLVSVAQEGDGFMLEEITVTATRREQTVQDIPYNISAVSGYELEAAHIVDSTDLMRSIPSINLVDRGHRNSGTYNGISIRGLSIDGAAFGDAAVNTVSTVSTYVNDTPLYANFILKDIERVEVLRGPQGTLYGSGSVGGTVRYIMREPQLGELSLKVGGTTSTIKASDGLSWSTDGVANVPLGEKAALRVSAGKIDQKGIIDYVNVYELDANGAPVAPSGILSDDASYREVEDADTVDIWYVRASLLFEPSDTFRLLASYHHQSDDIGGRRQETHGFDGFGNQYDDYEIGSVVLEPAFRDVHLASLEAELDLGFATLTSSTSYYKHDGDSINESTGFYAQNGWFSGLYYNYPRPIARVSRAFADEAFVQELRLVSNGENKLDYTVGAFYRNQDLLMTQDAFMPGFKAWSDAFFGFPAYPNEQDWAFSRDENFKDIAVFGELTYHITEDFRVTGGLRYFDNKLSNDTFMAFPLYPLTPPSISSFEFKDDDFLFKVNASWDFHNDHMVYATIAEGYRRGGSNAVPDAGIWAEDPAYQNYLPDSAINYEVGIKGTMEKLRYSAAAFYVDWSDVQINTGTPIGFYAAVNGNDARSYGIEMEAEGYLNESLRYTLGYTYINAKLSEDIFNPLGTLTHLDGARMAGTPEHSINIALNHTSELFGMTWVNRVDGYYQSSTRNSSNADLAEPGKFNTKLDGFTLWHFSSTLISNSSWDASLYVRNVFNEEGHTGEFTNLYMGTAPSEKYFGNGSKVFLVQPRTIGLAFNYKFSK